MRKPWVYTFKGVEGSESRLLDIFCRSLSYCFSCYCPYLFIIGLFGCNLYCLLVLVVVVSRCCRRYRHRRGLLLVVLVALVLVLVVAAAAVFFLFFLLLLVFVVSLPWFGFSLSFLSLVADHQAITSSPLPSPLPPETQNP